MERGTLEAVVRWQKLMDDEEPLEITFHGGEPLLPGASFYRLALPLLRDGLSPRRVQFSIQSNLWLLTDELCDLFVAYGVSLGTSLDGPEDLNDAQRGEGYFRQTMAGIERARAHGLRVGCICTFTTRSTAHVSRILDFFSREKLNISVHAALPSLTDPTARSWSLDGETYGELLVDLLDRYVSNPGGIRIHTIDSLCRSVASRDGAACIFGDCLGRHLAVAPLGEIYPCQRFAGLEDFQLGTVHDPHVWESMRVSPAWRQFERRQREVDEECGTCPDLDICRGGCPFHVLAYYGDFEGSLRDPHCPSFRRIFDTIVDRALEEVFAERNLQAIADCPEGSMFQVGRLLSLLEGR